MSDQDSRHEHELHLENEQLTISQNIEVDHLLTQLHQEHLAYLNTSRLLAAEIRRGVESKQKLKDIISDLKHDIDVLESHKSTLETSLSTRLLIHATEMDALKNIITAVTKERDTAQEQVKNLKHYIIVMAQRQPHPTLQELREMFPEHLGPVL